MKRLIIFAALMITVRCYGVPLKHQRYENLGNPAEYLFNATPEQIRSALERRPKHYFSPLDGGFLNNEEYSLGVYEYYTRRYWTGYQETDEDVDPPEAGKIGQITATFVVHFVPKSENQTLVSVAVSEFTQQVGRRYVLRPHFHKTHKSVTVKSDTYFEYLFLLKLGELLGEKNMPPIKGSDQSKITGASPRAFDQDSPHAHLTH
jgi:hypothetical protein